MGDTEPKAIFKIEAEGDTVYVHAYDRNEAKDRLFEIIGDIPEYLLTISEVDALPEGEEFL